VAAVSLAVGCLGYFLGPFGQRGDAGNREILALVESSATASPRGSIAYPQDGLSFASGGPLEVRVQSKGELSYAQVLLRPGSSNQYFVAPPLVGAGGGLFSTVVLLPQVREGEVETWVVVLVDFSQTSAAERPTVGQDSPLASRDAARFILPDSAKLLDARRVAVFGPPRRQAQPTVNPAPEGFHPLRPESAGVDRITHNTVDDYTPAAGV
jgi:hypothetical protein